MTNRTLNEIKEVIEEKGITAYKIFQNTSLTEAGISKIINGTTKKPQQRTLDVLNIFLDGCDIRIINQPKKYVKDCDAGAIWIDFESFLLVPLVEKRDENKFITGWGDEAYLETLHKIPWEVDKNYTGKYMSFEVNSDSMDSGNPRTAILERDILLTREVQRSQWVSPLHLIRSNFVIVHQDKGVLVSRIINHDLEDGVLTLHNLNPLYSDFEIYLVDVVAIFNVMDLHRKLLV
mgnify:CR=1 FL=1